MKKLKVLVFEYITGGGCNHADLPASLAEEGLLMLRALVADLAALAHIETVIMLDARMAGKIDLPAHISFCLVDPADDADGLFRQWLASCDAAWPIAPETDGILAKLCAEVERAGKLLLVPSADAVLVAGNKWRSYQCFLAHGVDTIPTYLLQNFVYKAGEWLIKPIDGAGCADSYVIVDYADFNRRTAEIDPANYLIQPHVFGIKTSLSCLFNKGQGWVLSINLQKFSLLDRQYKLTGLLVNISSDKASYAPVVAKVAEAIPGLWGYAGIDLIETEDNIYVLEINPRLTSSYAGIAAATGLNPAALVMQMLDGSPLIQPEIDRQVEITFSV